MSFCLPKTKKNLPTARKDNSGQTLIETVVAAFILTMGITAAVGLAVYAFGSSTNVIKQIIATGLAREGIEAVKNMRDTNWLKQTTINTNCYNYTDGSNTAKCYTYWLGDQNLNVVPFCLNPTNNNSNCNGSATTQNYNLSFDSSSQNFWILNRQFNSSNYGLNLITTAGNNSGFYSASNTVDGNSPYYRKIIITKITTSPFNTNIGPELQVTSQVWWTDKKCPRFADWPGLGGCSVELQTFLTNWKNY